MKVTRLSLSATVLFLALATGAQAQATRTWVSGTGDDVNPCSRTAPCKTYAGAQSKTAANGEISTLDPGGFGSLTVVKALVIDGSEQIAGVLTNAGGNGFVINAAATDNVILRNLDIHGTGTGNDGIRILSAKSVTIENCRIQGFAGQGIEIAPGANNVKVHLKNTVVRNNGSHGILILPTGAATVQLTVSDSQITGNGSNGVDVAGNNNSATVFNTLIANNTFSGFIVEQSTSTGFLEASTLAYNGTGVTSGTGIATSIVRMSRCMVVGNTTNGVTGSGTIVGFTNNTIVGNTGDNTISSSVVAQ
ncbi:MAG TPA: right-handed parallel beta-helix repeat-containing protein [Thermoanaerobaculia bacterium]